MIFSHSCNFRSVGASFSTDLQGEAPQSCMDLCRRRTVSLAAVLGSFHIAPGYRSLKPSGFAGGSGAAAVGGDSSRGVAMEQSHGCLTPVIRASSSFPRPA